MKFVIVALLTLALLTGCGVTHTNSAYSEIAPSVPEYTDEQYNQMAKELERNQCPMLKEAVKDCSVTRDQSRILKRN